jgi:hypothetical protein
MRSASLLLRVTAVVELLTGAAFLTVPWLPFVILFGQPLDGVLGLLAGRFIGAALLALGLACWWAAEDADSRAASGLITALLLYDALAALFLLYARMALGLGGIGLWPAVLAHVALALWCIHGQRQKGRYRSAPRSGQ